MLLGNFPTTIVDFHILYDATEFDSRISHSGLARDRDTLVCTEENHEACSAPSRYSVRIGNWQNKSWCFLFNLFFTGLSDNIFAHSNLETHMVLRKCVQASSWEKSKQTSLRANTRSFEQLLRKTLKNPWVKAVQVPQYFAHESATAKSQSNKNKTKNSAPVHLWIFFPLPSI